MKVKCEFCLKEFEPAEAQADLIEKNQSCRHDVLIMLECPNCYKDIALHIGEAFKVDTRTYRCPIIGCAGWVSYIKLHGEKHFWGCGECGSVWYRKENLYNHISNCIKRYSYRASCYKKISNRYIPGDGCDEVQNYEELVEKEPKEFGDDYVKG